MALAKAMLAYNLSRKLLFLFFFFFMALFCEFLSDPRGSQVRLYCGAYREETYSEFIPKFVEEMYSIAQKISSQKWATHSTNSTPPMYGLLQCFQDLSLTDCQLCFAVSRARIPRCIPSISASLFLDGCFLRYDNYSFYGESLDPKFDARNCSSNYGSVTNAESSEFAESVKTVVDNAVGNALVNGVFGVAEVKGRMDRRVYALAQCWETVSAVGCKACLNKAKEEVKECVPSREGRGMNAGCYLRYSTHNFYYDQNQSGDHGETELNKRFAKLGLRFKYEILEKATNYFDPSNKLGQGGAGIVFKGTLPNGQTVAVKRLFFNTTQWADEFFNEVNLIRGIQHKNLVKLLGCSIEGPESLLVYEFVPNKSLDHYFFDRNRDCTLNWKHRYNIVVGTAEGLAYLHGGTKTRIIHRDIKCSNVLLDEDFEPKIADFGLVRCFASGMTHLSTGIAGTLNNGTGLVDMNLII